jgi:hypothetical protein
VADVRLPAEERRVSRLFDLYHCEDVTYQLAVIMDDKQKALNRATRAAWAAFLQLPFESTRGGVLSSAQVQLQLFDGDVHHRAAVSPERLQTPTGRFSGCG